MKKLLTFVLASLLFSAASVAVTYTRQNARPTVFVGTPTYDSSGTVTHINIQSSLVQQMVNTADATDVRGSGEPIGVNFDLLDPTLTSTTITAAGKTVTYPQLAALMRQAVLDRANAAGVQ